MKAQEENSLQQSIPYSLPYKTGYWLIKLLNLSLNTFLVLILLISALIGVYGLWDNSRINGEADSSSWVGYKPEKEDTQSFEELKAINSEVQAWLTIYGTGIDYPVLYSEDEWKYLNHDPKGKFSLAGSLFYDSVTHPSENIFPTVIYGHHMNSGKMFGDLDKFLQEDFFRSHKYGYYFYDGRGYGVEILGVMKADAYDSEIYRHNKQDVQSRKNYWEKTITPRLIHKADTKVKETDRLLLLSTCANDATNGRTIVFARATDQLYEDTFVPEENTGFDLKDVGWFGIPYYAWILLVVALLLAFIYFLVRYRRNKNKKSKENV